MLEIGLGVKVILLTEGVGVVFLPKLASLFFKLSFPVKTAKKTITTTRPKMKETTLFRLSIYPILYHKIMIIQHPHSRLIFDAKKTTIRIGMENNPQSLYAWKAPLRPYKRRSGIIIRFYAAVALLLSAIMFFFGDKILLIPIWSLLFLFYVLTITPPPEVENKITTFGLEAAGITLRWEALSHFYFGKRFGFNTLTVVSQAPYFYHAYLVVPGEEEKKQIKEILSKHLMYQEHPKKTMTDKMLDFLSRIIPEEEDQEVPVSASKKD